MAKFIDKQERNANNSFVAKQLLEFLKDKYEHKMWIVIVFDPVHGQISDDFHMVLDQNGRSAVAKFYPKDSVDKKFSEDFERKLLKYKYNGKGVEETYNAFLKHVHPEPVKIIILEGKDDSHNLGINTPFHPSGGVVTLCYHLIFRFPFCYYYTVYIFPA